MWVVCGLKADRSVSPEIACGVWPNGAITESRVYPSKAVPLIDTFGQHKTRNDAVKALVVMHHPELADSSIEHLKRVSKCFTSGSLKTYKICKLAIQ